MPDEAPAVCTHDYQLDARKVAWIVSGKTVRFGYTCTQCGNRQEVDKDMGALTLAECQRAQADGLAVTC